MGDADSTSADTDTTDTDTTDNDALLSRLRLIEDQPLESRATAFAQIHEELQSRLESGDSSAAN